MKKTLLTMAACTVTLLAQAQTIDSVLACVERNNLELQALRKSNEAAATEVRAQNTLEDPSIEYSPFFQSGVSGMASSELVVSQGFDFPTLYSARRKSGRLQQSALDGQYQVARRDILLAAKNLCLDVIYQNKKKAVAELRRKNAQSLLEVFEKRMNDGDATVLEVNKIKMDRMGVETEAARIEADLQSVLQSLTALNGSEPVTLVASDYPVEAAIGDDALLLKATEADREVLAAQASVQASEQEVKVSGQGWIPKLEVGYRRNTDVSDASHGVLIGATFPLFSSRSKVKAAKAQHESAKLRLADTKIQVESRARDMIGQLKQMRRAMAAYDVPLMYNTLGLLRKAVEHGEISVIEYYAEADAVYRNIMSYMETERQYQGLLAELCKNDI